MLFKNRDKCLSQDPHFIYDEACLDIINGLDEPVEIMGQYVECNKCDYQSLYNLSAHANTSILINTKYSMRMHYVHDHTIQCDWDQELLEHYRYGWNLTDKCSSIYIKDPADNAYIPILSAFIILFFFGTIWYMIKCIYKCTKNNSIWRRLMWNSVDMENDLGGTMDTPLVIERPPPLKKHPTRIKSIDVFRGFCIMLMIFVNYGGGQYWVFKHSVWNGITVADFVFPWFLWIMGFSLSVSINNKLRRAVPRRQLVIQVIRRALVLILLGLVLNSHGRASTLATLRFPGVLQRIGITYFIVGIIEALFARRSNNEYSEIWYKIPDILIAWPQWILMTTLLIIHTSVVMWVNVPGCGKGYLGPGGLQDSAKHFNCTGGVAGYIDRAVFGEHMYKHPTCQKVYETTQSFDPEGILGTLTSAFLVFLGVHAGRILHTYTSVHAKVIRWIICGFICGIIGGILCGFSKDGGVIPLNKNLWSLSFILALAGLATIIQTFLFVVIDIMHKWGGRPFFYPGMNSLALYILHELFKNTFPFAWTPTIETHASYLGMNLWATAIWVSVSIYMYKRNIFISI